MENGELLTFIKFPSPLAGSGLHRQNDFDACGEDTRLESYPLSIIAPTPPSPPLACPSMEARPPRVTCAKLFTLFRAPIPCECLLHVIYETAERTVPALPCACRKPANTLTEATARDGTTRGPCVRTCTYIQQPRRHCPAAAIAFPPSLCHQRHRQRLLESNLHRPYPIAARLAPPRQFTTLRIRNRAPVEPTALSSSSFARAVPAPLPLCSTETSNHRQNGFTLGFRRRFQFVVPSFVPAARSGGTLCRASPSRPAPLTPFKLFLPFCRPRF